MAPLQISAATAGHKFSTISSPVRVDFAEVLPWNSQWIHWRFLPMLLKKTTGLLGMEFGENGPKPYEAMFSLVNLDLIMVFKAY